MTHKARLEDGKIVSREPCPKRSAENPHCWHLLGATGSDPASGDNPFTTTATRFLCCYCGKRRVQKFEQRAPRGHGPFAVKETVQVSDTEEP